MTNVIEWLAMGGYALYVWPAYGLVFVVLAMHLVGIKCKGRRTRKQLRQWFK